MLLNRYLLPKNQANHLHQFILEHSTFQRLVSQFSPNTDQNKQLLQDLFLLLSPSVKHHVPDIDIGCFGSDISHIKHMLFSLSTPAGLLDCELMYFTGDAWTNPHTHPEYIVDEIITGSLEEHLYAKNHVNSAYKLTKKQVRSAGDLRAIYDPEGFPHNVKGLGDGCVTLCLCLGVQVMQSIDAIKA